jgi:hypothetical protein
MVETKRLDMINKSIYLLGLFFIIFRKQMIIFVDMDVQSASLNSLLLYGAIGLFLLQYMVNKFHSKKGIYFLGIAGLLFLITRDGAILSIVVMALAMEKLNDKFIVKSFFTIQIILFICGVLCSIFFPEITHRPEMHYRVVNGYNYARYSFGTGNPNAVFSMLLPVYAGYIYLRYDKYNIFDRLAIILSALVIYSQTDSRTGLLSIIAGFIMIEILRKIDLKQNKFIKWMISYFPVIITLISVSFALFLYNNPVIIKLLSSRAMYWYVYIKKYGSLFTLFGNEYTTEFKTGNPLDNSYIYIIAILGMVSMILLLIVSCKGLKEYVNRNMKKNIVCVLMFFIFAFGENLLIDSAISFSLMMLIKDVIIFNSEEINIYTYYKQMPRDIIDFFKMIKNKFIDFKNNINTLKNRRRA